MKLTEIFNVLQKIAPVKLSDEFCAKYGLYDNSGIIINCAEEIKGVCFSLDLSEDSVKFAKEHGCNLIVTHHPAIYGGIEKIDAVNPATKNIAECIKCGISVISMHLNFDCAPLGIDYYLMRGLGGTEAEILADITGGGYGRAYEIKPVLFNNYIENIKKEFITEKVFAYGENKEIKKVASFCGAGCDDNAINFAVLKGADAFVSSDLKHHEILKLLSNGINVIQLTHYSSENYGFNKIYKEISKNLTVPSAYYADVKMS